MSGKIKVKVAEALQNDVGRGLVRMSTQARKELGVTSGDIVKIKGNKETAAKVWQSHPQDEKKNIARIDGVIRQNAGVSIGDNIAVEKAEPKPAEKVMLAPTQKIKFSPGFEKHVKKQLTGRPVSKEDKVVVGVFGTSLLLVAKDTNPGGVVKVTRETQIEVKKKPAKEVKGMPHVTYEDIGGLDEEIQKIREMVEIPMKHPEIFERLGIDPPKGVLLQGPPGTGKTLMAKAVANESDANFINIQGPEVMSKFVGEAEKKIRKIFDEAEENSPTIIFIDEIDAIAPKREEATGEVERRVVSQILASMDGLEARGDVVVIAATNRANALDPALRRPGRFDREIEIGVPDREARKEILQIHTRNMPLSDDVDLQRFSERTHGFVGADIESLAKESAMKSLRRILPEVDLEEEGIPEDVIQDLQVTKEDFDEAMKEIQPSAMREVLVQVPKVTWDDVGGLESAKQSLVESVEWPLTKPEKFEELGVEPPSGILLFGPPGTGKTLLAKAVANESEYNFIAVNGPELLSKWVGESEKAVREIFRKARQAAPVVVFFDELDSLAPRRGSSSGGSNVTESVVNQILSELDGLEDMKDVVVIGSSNRPELIDPALLRPGRFDEMILVPAPDEEARKKIFEVHTRDVPTSEEVELDELAKKTEGYSGADIKRIVQEASMEAVRNDEKEVSKDNLEEAIEKISPSITSVEKDKYAEFIKEHGKEETAASASYID